MSDVVTAARAAAATLAAAAGGPAVAVAMAVAPDAVRRMLIDEHGVAHGSLGAAALDERALRIAGDAFGTAGHAGTVGPSTGAETPVVETVSVDDVQVTLYVEVHRAPDQLVIVGAGHIAVPLAQLGVLLGFRTTVLDDREDMATAERFDDAVHVLRSDFATDPFAGVPLGAHSYIALVTRGHRWDFDCLQRLIALDIQPRYIGMIGSRRRVRAAFHALLESGVSRELLATIRAPIGIELQAETPAEIAVAIAAEIVAVRRGADIASIGSRERVLERFL
jgi:xanthine/CO dehydrogenase XdhC/CoxF family maturation factor